MANIKMPFGKYKNKRLSKIPTDYLEWCRDKCDTLTDEVRRAVEEELADRAGAAAEPEPEPRARQAEAGPKVVKLSPLGQTVAGDVRMMFRNLALKYHPDRGGSPEAMKALNEFHEALQDLFARTFDAP